MNKQNKVLKVAEKELTNIYYEDSVVRGKALSILEPCIKQEELHELLAELYDLRVENKELKRKIKN